MRKIYVWSEIVLYQSYVKLKYHLLPHHANEIIFYSTNHLRKYVSQRSVNFLFALYFFFAVIYFHGNNRYPRRYSRYLY